LIRHYLLEVVVAALATALWYWWVKPRPALMDTVCGRFDAYAARRRVLFIVAAMLLSPVLRFAVLPWVPAPVPRIADEFVHLLVADTLVHGHLANPPHPLADHLETIFVLQRPAYASKYPIGQGLILAIGTILTGQPWAGMLLASALMCGAISWALFGCVPAGWAAIGGLLAAIVLGSTSGWINMFWGGAFCAFGGALLFGALVRLWKAPSPILGLTAGLGWAIVWLIRPFESLIPLAFTWGIVIARTRRDRGRWRSWVSTIALLGIVQLGAGGLTALHNRAVTGSFTTLPYVLSQRIYGVPQSFFGQAPIEVARFKTPEQEAVYWQQRKSKERSESHPLRHLWGIAASAWAFYVTGWLSLPVALGLMLRGDPRIRLCRTMLAGALLTSSLYGPFLPHYWAAYGVVFVFLAIQGLICLTRWRPSGTPLGWVTAFFLTVGVFASVLRVVPMGPILGLWGTGYVAPLRRQLIDRLNEIEGRHVVFVQYGPSHDAGEEWVYNGAVIDAARIVWFRALSPEEDAEVIRYYPGRTFWVAEMRGNFVRVTRLRLPGSPSSDEGASHELDRWMLPP
jgi:hypothetical protein